MVIFPKSDFNNSILPSLSNKIKQLVSETIVLGMLYVIIKIRNGKIK